MVKSVLAETKAVRMTNAYRRTPARSRGEAARDFASPFLIFFASIISFPASGRSQASRGSFRLWDGKTRPVTDFAKRPQFGGRMARS